MTDVERKAWLKERQTGIGGSDVAAILGMIPKYKTPVRVFEEKLAPEPIEIPDNEFMEWGRRLEDAVALAYSEKTGRKIQNSNKVIRSKTHPFLIASIDRLILSDKDAVVEREEMKGPGILEVKTAGHLSPADWDGEVPVQYYCQIQHYMFVRDVKWGAFAILQGGNRFRIVTVMRDDEYLAKQVAALEEFWKENVQTNTPPTKLWPDYAAAKALIGDPVEATADIISKVTELVQLKERMATDKKLKEELEHEIQEFLGEHDTLTGEGYGVIATWKLQKGRSTVDSAKLQEEFPKAYEACVTSGDEFRVLRTKLKVGAE